MCFINCGEFLEWLSCSLHFKKHIAPWRFFFVYWVLSHYWSDYNHSKIDLSQLQNLRSYHSVNQKNVHNSSSYNTYCNIVVIVINRVRFFFLCGNWITIHGMENVKEGTFVGSNFEDTFVDYLKGVVVSCWTYKPGETEK